VITRYEVITDADDCSDHRPVTAVLDLDAAPRLKAVA
jgi:hypothetical protein